MEKQVHDRIGKGGAFFLIAIITGMLVLVFLTVKEQACGGACRITLPHEYYDSPEAGAAARVRGGVRPMELPREYAQPIGELIQTIAAEASVAKAYPALPAGPIKERVLHAIDTASRVEPSPCTWHWNDVLKILASFGEAIPIVMPRPEDRLRFEHVPMAFALNPRALMVNPEHIEKMSDSLLVTIVVHEATHGVVQRLLEESSSYSPAELIAAQRVCGKFDAQITHLHEALATWNELRIAAAIAADSNARDAIDRNGLLAIEAFDDGNPKPFASVAIENLRIRIALFETGQGLDPDCVYPPILRGRNRQRAFILNAIDDPLVHSFALATRLFRDDI